jgi:uncharacterized protein (DUF2235 family)
MARVFSLVVTIAGVFIAAATATWWFNSIAIGLFLRRVERWPVVRQGSLKACINTFRAIFAGFSVATVLVVGVVYWLLSEALSSWLFETLPTSLYSFGYWFVAAAIVVAVMVGVFSGFSEAREAVGAARRRRFLFDPQFYGPPDGPFAGQDFVSPPHQEVDVPRQTGPGRRIVVLCDGTANRPDTLPHGESTATNIWKLSQMLEDDDLQTVWYEAGVGSDSSSTAQRARRTQRLLATTGVSGGVRFWAGFRTLLTAIEGGFGVGISETIVNAYKAIVHLYRPGDRIYLVGFSRGAFAARCIAGVISRCGLLRVEHERFSADVVQIYRTRREPADEVRLRLDMVYPGRGSSQAGRPDCRHNIAVEFLGVFDTVASLGFPLWGWWFRFSPIWENRPFSTDPAGVCQNIYHALAMDERRSQFFPTLFTKPKGPHQPATLQQVWFRGAHADLGGGYTRHDLSDVPLHWMMTAMMRHGLTFKARPFASLVPNLAGTLHDELVRQPTWNFFGSWPRWHPVPGPDEALQTSSLHPSVIERARQVEAVIGRPDLSRIADAREFVVNANVAWYRTGLIIENRQYYKLTYLGGVVRDAEDDPAGPDGQSAGWADFRRIQPFKPRLAGLTDKWMLLGAAIAHPRIWTPQEKGWQEALRYLFRRAPDILLDQIATIGDDLPTVGDCLYIWSEAPSGLLYMFVNDLWQTAGNNSGGTRLRIEPVTEDEIQVNRPLYALWHTVEDGNNGDNETNWWARYNRKEDMPPERPPKPTGDRNAPRISAKH